MKAPLTLTVTCYVDVKQSVDLTIQAKLRQILFHGSSLFQPKYAMNCNELQSARLLGIKSKRT